MTASVDLDCRTACERLCMDFAHFVDARRHAEFLALFAEDRVFSRPTDGFKGQKELRRFLEQRPVDVTTRHLCTTVRIEPSTERRTSGTCCVLMFQAPTGALPLVPASVKFVEYDDRFVYTAAEAWRFESRTARVIFDLPSFTSSVGLTPTEGHPRNL